MQSILRSVNQAVKGMAPRIPGLARRKELLVQPPRLLLRRTSTRQPHQCLKDLGVPNSSWSPEMMGQFQKFTKLSEDGSWQRVPSHNSCVDSMPVRSKSGYNPRKQKDACLFVRSVAAEGRGFEFAMFYNEAERQMVVLLQPGSYLEGMIGLLITSRSFLRPVTRCTGSCTVGLWLPSWITPLRVAASVPLASW